MIIAAGKGSRLLLKGDSKPLIPLLGVTIIEQRPSFPDKSVWVDIPVSQLRFNIYDYTWTLYCPDRNSQWHLYWECDPTKNIDDLLEEIDEDPTGIFWG